MDRADLRVLPCTIPMVSWNCTPERKGWSGWPDALFHRWENLKFIGDSGYLEVRVLTGDCADVASLACQMDSWWLWW